MIFANIYTTKDCMKCRQTKRQLKMNSCTTDITNIDSVIQKLRDKGVQTMPYVTIYDEDENGWRKKLDSWSNYRFDKIQEWNKKFDEMGVNL